MLGAFLQRAARRAARAVAARLALRRHGRGAPALRRRPPRLARRLGDRHGRRRRRRPSARCAGSGGGDAGRRDRARRRARATRAALWEAFLDDAARRFRSIAPLDPTVLPAGPRRGGGRARPLGRAGHRRLARPRSSASPRITRPCYLRPSAEASAGLRALAARGVAHRRLHRRTRARSRGSRSRTSVPRGGSMSSRPARAPSSGSCRSLDARRERRSREEPRRTWRSDLVCVERRASTTGSSTRSSSASTGSARSCTC